MSARDSRYGDRCRPGYPHEDGRAFFNCLYGVRRHGDSVPSARNGNGRGNGFAHAPLSRLVDSGRTPIYSSANDNYSH